MLAEIDHFALVPMGDVDVANASGSVTSDVRLLHG
jgi:hypothetical protein